MKYIAQLSPIRLRTRHYCQRIAIPCKSQSAMNVVRILVRCGKDNLQLMICLEEHALDQREKHERQGWKIPGSAYCDPPYF